ncbi:hypothetical protein CDL15_Pgr016115 [Punica granatum]|uniref:Uncharacterized protein n=1 Tax=Punica granatum TaxID=22663 RepID=A0A218X1N0_PUNGR|nr:hypothetical protein CDL15_Pgr016115 [Punica granatum]PKI62941.1 hypothetical protein CRG98_016580 [Punica granatum]
MAAVMGGSRNGGGDRDLAVEEPDNSVDEDSALAVDHGGTSSTEDDAVADIHGLDLGALSCEIPKFVGREKLDVR